ncbi:MAG TPA: glycosyltransferase [Gemmataceae bacterium]
MLSSNPVMPSLSVIILTFNEESNLAAALDSVKGWAAEVFVVDSYSTDRTVEIALERAADGVRVVQRRFENYSDQSSLEAISLIDLKGVIPCEPSTSEESLK